MYEPAGMCPGAGIVAGRGDAGRRIAGRDGARGLGVDELGPRWPHRGISRTARPHRSDAEGDQDDEAAGDKRPGPATERARAGGHEESHGLTGTRRSAGGTR